MADLFGVQEQVNQFLKQIDPYRFSADQFELPRNRNLQQMMEYLNGFNERNDERQDQLRWLNYVLRGKEYYRDNPNNPEEQEFANDLANKARGQLPESLQSLVSAETPYARAVANVDIFKNGYPRDPLRAIEEIKNAWGNANYNQSKAIDPNEIQRLEREKQIAHEKANIVRAYSASQGNPIPEEMTLGDVRRAIQDRDAQRKAQTAEWLKQNNLDPRFGVYDPKQSSLLGRQSLGTEPGKDMVNRYFEMGQQKAEQVYLADQRSRDTARRIIEQKNRYESAQQDYIRATEVLNNPNLTAAQREELIAMQQNSMEIMRDANEKAEMTRRIAKENGINLAGFTANDTIKQSEENLMNESLKAIDEVYNGKYRLNSDQFFDKRYQYYKQQGIDNKTAMNLAREEAIRYKYMRMDYMRDVTPEVINGGRIENSQQLSWLMKLSQEDPEAAQMLWNASVLPNELYKRADDRQNELQDRALEEASKSGQLAQRFQNALALINQKFLDQSELIKQKQEYTQTNMATANDYNTNLAILRHNLGLETIDFQGKVNAANKKFEYDLKDRNAINDHNRTVSIEKIKLAGQYKNQIDVAKYKKYLDDEEFKLAWDRFSATVTTDFMEQYGLKTGEDVFNWFMRSWYNLNDPDKQKVINGIKATKTDSDDKVLNMVDSYRNDLENAFSNSQDDKVRDLIENLFDYLDSDKFRESSPETKMESIDMLQEVITAIYNDPYKKGLITREQAEALLYEMKQLEEGNSEKIIPKTNPEIPPPGEWKSPQQIEEEEKARIVNAKGDALKNIPGAVTPTNPNAPWTQYR